MKILLLNHHVDAQHKISARLQAAGAVLLIPSHNEEAWKMIQLHGSSLDLAIIHREGEKEETMDEGEKLLARIKADPAQVDLPIIFTSSQWNEADFFQHQQGPMGANAYLRWPFTDDELIETIETMFGNSIRFAASTLTDTHSKTLNRVGLAAPAETSGLKFTGMDVRLEEAPPVSELPGLSLDPPLELASEGAIPGSAPTGAAFSLEPAVVGGESAETIGIVGSAGSAESAEPALPDLPDLMNPQQLASSMLEELEPHERLEIDRQLKLSSASSPGNSGDLSVCLNEAPEAGTMVLDPASMGLQIAEAPSSFELAQPEAEAPVAASEISLQQTASRVAVVNTQSSGGSGGDEEELASELPYLFSHKKPGEASADLNSALVFAEPVGDAVIPGGAVQSPDTETLKKYLMLREQDVAVLSNQLKSARDQIAHLEKRLREEAGKGGELEHALGDSQKRIEEFEKEKALALQGLQAEIDELRFQNKTKTDKARLLESKVNEATDEIERLKERVRNDIRKIRVREKELENKLEIVRKDSEALITAREVKIMELKRKIDLLEFNIDLLQDQNAREKENSAQLRERLAKAAQVVRVAGGLLDSQGKAIIEEAGSEKKDAREAS
jgi:CheY-like chemotaxis protein